jgi:lysylphosphatidylglycerol synthetase-like protein (DUF2156 family)
MISKNSIDHDFESGVAKALLFDDNELPQRHRSQTHSIVSFDTFLFRRHTVTFKHEKIRFWETVFFAFNISSAAIVLAMYRQDPLKPLAHIEVYSVVLSLVYLALQFLIMRVLADAMLPFANTIRVDLKNVSIMVLLLILVLIVSMVLETSDYHPETIAIPMAILWRIFYSLTSLMIFCRIDSFFFHYKQELTLFINHWDAGGDVGGADPQAWDAVEREDQLQRVLKHTKNLTKVNKYLYIGFFLCVTTMMLFYTVLYAFDDAISDHIKVIMYCAFVFVTCSTYFLLSVCELTKLANQLPKVIKSHIKIKIKILHWEPSGDLMVAYALGLLFKVFVNITRAMRINHQ